MQNFRLFPIKFVITFFCKNKCHQKIYHWINQKKHCNFGKVHDKDVSRMITLHIYIYIFSILIYWLYIDNIFIYIYYILIIYLYIYILILIRNIYIYITSLHLLHYLFPLKSIFIYTLRQYQAVADGSRWITLLSRLLPNGRTCLRTTINQQPTTNSLNEHQQYWPEDTNARWTCSPSRTWEDCPKRGGPASTTYAQRRPSKAIIQQPTKKKHMRGKSSETIFTQDDREITWLEALLYMCIWTLVY